MVLVEVIELIIDKNRTFHQLRNLKKGGIQMDKSMLIRRRDMLRRNVKAEHVKEI